MSQLKVNSIRPIGGVPTGGGGGIVQTVQYNTNTQSSTTGQTFVASGLSGSITTVNANSKIIVFVAQNFYISGNASTGGGINVNRVISGTETVLDDGPRSSTGPYGVWSGGSSGSPRTLYGRYNIQYLDSPNQAAGTTITYNTKIASYSSSYTIVVQVGNTGLNEGTSYLTLMEVSV